MSNENMKLWNAVCETDPAITKRVTMRGNFTAIDSQTQVKRATELWGSYGANWGLKDVKFNEFREGDKIVGLMAYGTFIYPNCLTGFPIAADMPYKSNDDCVKKLQTECISKALSRLGFNSDVFEGKFDDNRYVSEMTKKYAQQKQDLQTDITKSKVAEPEVVEPKVDIPIGGLHHLVEAQENEILNMIEDELTMGCDDNYKGVVDMDLLRQAIIGEYGKLPLKESSVRTVVDKMLELCKDDNSLIFVDTDDVIKGI